MTDIGDTTAALSEYIRRESFDALPEEVVELVRWHVVDTVGCILYGSTRPWVRRLVRALDELGDSDGTTAVGHSLPLPPERAALVNGTASHAMDFDDYTQDAGVHAGSAVVPAALAFSEATDRTVSGEEFLTAVAVGDEVGIRSGYGIGFGSLRGGLHIAGWTGAFAGAATAGKLYGLSREGMANALGLAGTQGCGLTGAHAAGADAKRFHMGKAAESGYLAAALANASFTGDTHIFEDRHGGIGPTMSTDYDIPAVTDGLGERYETTRVLTLKPYPLIGGIHTSVDAVKGILEAEGLSPDEVARVEIGQTEAHKRHIGWDYEPRGVMAAQASIQYAVATLLEDGDVTLSAFTEEAIRRPAVLERVEDIDVVVDEALEADDPSSFGAVVELTTTDGRTFENTLLTPPGVPENPLSEEELEAKFRDQAAAVLPDPDAEALLEFLLDVENRDDVTALFDHLAAAGG